MNFFEKTPLNDAYIYTPKVIQDHRGYFMESFNQKHFIEIGMTEKFVQDNRSYSSRGTLRGLHFQIGASAQAKLVGVLSGEVLDVIVDLRKDSSTFKKSFQIKLNADEKKFLYVPRGFAHGFLVLSEKAEFFYKCDNYYDFESERGIRFDDPTLSIDWGMDPQHFVLSEKDRKLPSLEQYLGSQ